LDVKRSRAQYLGSLLAAILATPALAGSQMDMQGMVKAWEQSFNTGDLEAVVSMYTEDGCRMPPDEMTANGRAAILQQLESTSADGGTVELGLTRSDSLGGMGYATGTYRIIGSDGAQLDAGKWMNAVIAKDGNWYIVCDIWNSDPP
jgi:ketosteroid isomerase-like protein